MASLNSNNNNNLIERRKSRFLQSPHCAANSLQDVRSSGQGAIACISRATHRALITCNMSCAAWNEGTVQQSRLAKLELHLFSFILLAETVNRRRRGGNRSNRRKPLTTSFRKCPVLKPENSSPNRDSNSHSSIGGRLGKQTC